MRTITNGVCLTILLSVCGCKKNDTDSSDARFDNKGAIERRPEQLTPLQGVLPSSQEAIRERATSLAADLTSLIGPTPGGNVNITQWRRIYERYWPKSFDARLPEDLDTSKLIAAFGFTKPIAVQLATGQFENLPTQEERDAVIALHSLATLIALNGGTALPYALMAKGTSDTLTRGDAILYQVFGDAISDVDGQRELSAIELQDWLQLAQSPNPLWRRLALDAFWKVSADPEQWLKLYQSYERETDRDILRRLADQTFSIGTPEMLPVLRAIEFKLAQPADAELKKHVINLIAAILENQGAKKPQ